MSQIFPPSANSYARGSIVALVVLVATLGLTLDRIDILISEMALDDMPGAALADRLRRNHAGLRSLFMADVGTPQGDGLLVRPFTRDDLLVELDALSSSATSPRTS